MIFVTLGTQDKSFKRLLKLIDELKEKKKIRDRVIVQAGYTKYESKNMEIYDFLPKEKMIEYIKDASIMITHGGVGSILDGLKYHKKIIAAARLKEYNEHTNDHQLQIVKEFAKEGYILALNNFSDIDEVLEQAKTFEPKEYKSNNTKFNNMIAKIITDDNHTHWLNRVFRHKK